ncbi:hypothetical protein MXB_867, partial [Myxobolus squamalis]
KAENSKNDGNAFYRNRKFEDAIKAYSIGISANPNPLLLASLYNNRAQCYFVLKNYENSYSDCLNCIKHHKNHQKTIHRGNVFAKTLLACHCTFFLKKYEECIAFCDKYL